MAIQGVGRTAQDFNIHARGLPGVTNLFEPITKSGPNVVVSFTNRLYADNHLHTSTNLNSWVQTRSHHRDPDSDEQPRRLPCRRRHGVPPHGPSVVHVFHRSAKEHAREDPGDVVLEGHHADQLHERNTGSYTSTFTNPGKVSYYACCHGHYRGLLWPIYFGSENPTTLALEFATATAWDDQRGNLRPRSGRVRHLHAPRACRMTLAEAVRNQPGEPECAEYAYEHQNEHENGACTVH